MEHNSEHVSLFNPNPENAYDLVQSPQGKTLTLKRPSTPFRPSLPLLPASSIAVLTLENLLDICSHPSHLPML